MKRRAAEALLFSFMLLTGPAALAQGPGSEGQQLFLHGAPGGVVPCAACHGMQGQGQPDMGAPSLAGQPAPRLLAELHVIAGKAGGNVVMQRVAADLSPPQREAVAGYLSSLPAP